MPHAMTEDHAYDEAEAVSRAPTPLTSAPAGKRRGDVELRLVEPTAKALSTTAQPSAKTPIKRTK